MKINIAIIPEGRDRRPQLAMTPRFITIHNTGVPNVPADNFKRSCHDITQDDTISYHYVVDEKEIIQLIPDDEVAWHAGNKNGNYNSIAVEICERDGAEEHAIELVKHLMEKHKIKIDNVVPHKYWSGKNCPRLILPRWEAFMNEIKNDKNNEVSEWARGAVEYCQKEGLLVGDDRGFRPKDNMTREEMACVIYRIVKHLNK